MFRLIWHDHLNQNALEKQMTIFVVQLTAYTYLDNPIHRCRTICGCEEHIDNIHISPTDRYLVEPHVETDVEGGTTSNFYNRYHL